MRQAKRSKPARGPPCNAGRDEEQVAFSGARDDVFTNAGVQDHPINMAQGNRVWDLKEIPHLQRAPREFAAEAPRDGCGNTTPGNRQMSDNLRTTRYSTLSLKDIVCLCAGPCDNEAWEEFVFRVGKPISLTVMRTASLWGNPSRPLVEDLIQATYLKLWEGGCRLLRDFAIQRPEAILGYLKKTAANATHDYFKHGHSQSSGGDNPHVSTSDVDPEAGKETHGSEEKIAFEIFLSEIDEYLKQDLTGPDAERDRMIFWLYFRQGMSTKEIASLPTVGLSAKGVGSVIERLKHSLREQVLAGRSEFDQEEEEESKANSLANSY
jgi:RNA polymerase sigma factor (sigma-70 family)